MAPHPSVLRSLIGAAAALTAAITSSCRSDDAQIGWWERERESIELSQSLKLRELELKLARPSSKPGELLEIRQTLLAHEGAVNELRSRKEQLSQEVVALESSQAVFRSRILASCRTGKIGEELGELPLPSGRIFRDVTVASITDAGITLRHQDGMTRLKVDDLSPDQQAEFGLDPDAAAVATRKETESSAEYNRWMDHELAVQQRDAMEQARQDRIAAANAAPPRPATVFIASVIPTDGWGADSWSRSLDWSSPNPRSWSSRYSWRSWRSSYRYHNVRSASYCAPRSVPAASRTPVRAVFSSHR